jgi:antitoxin MazE
MFNQEVLDMTHLIKIGNSQGIRIPKPLIQQARLEGKELELHVVSEGILVSPAKRPREGWQESIQKTLETKGTEDVDNEWLDASLTNADDLES